MALLRELEGGFRRRCCQMRRVSCRFGKSKEDRDDFHVSIWSLGCWDLRSTRGEGKNLRRIISYAYLAGHTQICPPWLVEKHKTGSLSMLLLISSMMDPPNTAPRGLDRHREGGECQTYLRGAVKFVVGRGRSFSEEKRAILNLGAPCIRASFI